MVFLPQKSPNVKKRLQLFLGVTFQCKYLIDIPLLFRCTISGGIPQKLSTMRVVPHPSSQEQILSWLLFNQVNIFLSIPGVKVIIFILVGPSTNFTRFNF